MPESLADLLLPWWAENGRRFPWRRLGLPPWHVLLTEVLLRRTRAEHVAAHWEEIIAVLATPALTAAAAQEALVNLLEPLGLGRQRAGAVQALARVLVSEYGGKVPWEYGALVRLPHIGRYAAAAVLCFAFGESVPVVDSNVLRVFERLTGQDLGRDNRAVDWFWWHLGEEIPQGQGPAFNWALLDLGGLVCRPRNPRCQACPLRGECQAYLSRG